MLAIFVRTKWMCLYFLYPAALGWWIYRSHSTFSKTLCKTMISNVVSVSYVQGLQDLQGHFCITSMWVTFIFHSYSNLTWVNGENSCPWEIFLGLLAPYGSSAARLAWIPSDCCCTLASQKNLYKPKAFKVFFFLCPI